VATRGIATLQYDPDGRETTFVLSSGVSRKTGYDAAGQIVSLVDTTTSATLVQQFGFVYDGVGNRTVVSDGAGSLTTYTMDAKNRLTADNTSGTNAHNYTYSYDEVDNRLSSSETGVVVDYTYDLSGRLQSSTDGGAYTYDADGNLTAVSGLGSTANMSYDMADRLVQYTQGSSVSTFTYDGNGLKRSENSGSGVTTLVWDGNNYLQGRS
jgi:YD repeat-containing protein